MKAYVVLSISDLKDMIEKIKMGPMNKKQPASTTGVFEATVKPDSKGDMQIASYELVSGRELI